MNIRSLYRALCEHYPEDTRCAFDLDGLQLCPDEAREVKTVVCALDVTRESVDYAVSVGADVLLTHHPILFAPVRTLDPASSMDAENATRLLTHSVAHISLHTRFDAGKCGINDTLAHRLHLQSIAPFGLAEDVLPLGRIGVLPAPLVPEDFARAVADALGTHVLLTKGDGMISTVAVVGGAAGDYLDEFAKSSIDAMVTGEVAHHRRLLSSHAGKTLVEAGHYGSEVLFCDAVQEVLRTCVPSAELLPFSSTAHEICVLPREH